MRYLALTVVIVSSTFLSATAMAQSSGMFGSRSLGSGISAGSRSFGTNPNMGVGTGGGFGNTGLGMGAGSGLSSQSSVGQLDSSSRFLRQNRDAGSFVGADTQEVATYVLGGQQTSMMRSTATNLPRSTARTSRTSSRSTAARRNSRSKVPELRTALRVAFDYPIVPSAQINSVVDRRVQSALGPQRLRLTATSFGPDGTLTLRGTVATEHDRDLAERLALLEPGVRKVDNQLQVASAATTPAALTSGAP
ncbi:MAG: BON domain-containing protein [Planctomycetota bacterium]